MNKYVCTQDACGVPIPCKCEMDDRLVPLNCLYEHDNRQLWKRVEPINMKGQGDKK